MKRKLLILVLVAFVATGAFAQNKIASPKCAINAQGLGNWRMARRAVRDATEPAGNRTNRHVRPATGRGRQLATVVMDEALPIGRKRVTGQTELVRCRNSRVMIIKRACNGE
jgi:hypothetical protein